MVSYKSIGNGLVTGVHCVVRAGTSAATAKTVGLVSECSIRKQVQTQRAEVVGEMLPVSIDPTGISVNITFRGFVLKKGVSFGDMYTPIEFNPDDDSMIQSQRVGKIPYIEIYDKNSNTILGATEWAVITSFEESVNKQGYVSINCSFEGIGFLNGTDYPTTALYQ